MVKRAAVTEAWVKKKIKDILKANGIWYFMPSASTGGYGTAGVPDFICCAYGKFLAIEAKANGGKPTDLQHAQIKKIRAARGYAIVIDETRLDTLAKLLPMLKD